jgi:hypothetical protein
MTSNRPPENAPPPRNASLLEPVTAISSLAALFAGALISGAEPLSLTTWAIIAAGTALVCSSQLFGSYFDQRDPRNRADAPMQAAAFPSKTAYLLAWVLLIAGISDCAAFGLRTAAAGLTVALLHTFNAIWLRRVWGVNFLWFGLMRASLLLLGAMAAVTGLGYMPLPMACVALYSVSWALLRAARQPGAPPATGFVSLLQFAAALGFAISQLLGKRFYAGDALVYLVACAAVSLARWVRAVIDGRPGIVLEAVQWGFLGMTLMEASFAAGAAGVTYGLLVALWVAPLYSLLREHPISLLSEPR